MSRYIVRDGRVYLPADTVREIHAAAIDKAKRVVEYMPKETEADRRRRWHAFQEAYDDVFSSGWRAVCEEEGVPRAHSSATSAPLFS